MILNKEISLLLEEFKAENIVSLDVKNKSSVTDTMIIASGRSTRHVKSISDNIIKPPPVLLHLEITVLAADLE